MSVFSMFLSGERDFDPGLAPRTTHGAVPGQDHLAFPYPGLALGKYSRISWGVFSSPDLGLANEDSSLESVVDWLADDVARALPNFPPWLCVLRFDQDLGVSNLPSSNKGYFHPKHSRQEKTRNKLNIGHVEVGTPRPPAEPPASARGRPKSFARRLLHQFQGVVVHARKG